METRVDPTDLDGQPNRKIRERVRTQTITTPEGNPKPDQTLGKNLYSFLFPLTRIWTHALLGSLELRMKHSLKPNPREADEIPYMWCHRVKLPAGPVIRYETSRFSHTGTLTRKTQVSKQPKGMVNSQDLLCRKDLEMQELSSTTEMDPHSNEEIPTYII